MMINIDSDSGFTLVAMVIIVVVYLGRFSR
jgi:hypothetical protein